MRSLIILKGLVKKDKKSWIRKEGLENFTLDIENIKTLFYRPDYKGGGRDYLIRSYDDQVYKIFIQSLCSRLSTGMLVVIDPESEPLGSIEDLATIYGYTVFYHVESIPAGYVGKNRKYVNPRYITPSKETLEKEVGEFNRIDWSDKNLINSYEDVEIWWRKYNKPKILNPKDEVLFISDLHSHWNIFKNHIPSSTGLTVLLGDYIDGPEKGGSRKLVDHLLECPKKNMMWLEGNHELRLRKYLGWSYLKSKGKKVVSEILEGELNPEFMTSTALEFGDIKGDDALEYVKAINEKLLEYLIFDRGNETFICSHAGLRWVEQLCPKFIGNVIYSGKNVERVDQQFSNQYKDNNLWSIHGHCKYTDMKFRKYPNILNLDTENERMVNYAICKPNGKIKIQSIYENRR